MAPVASYWRQWRLILALRLRDRQSGSDLLHHSNPDVIVIKGGNTVKIHRLPLSVKRKVVMKPARVPQTVVAPDCWGDLPGESFIARRWSASSTRGSLKCMVFICLRLAI